MTDAVRLLEAAHDCFDAIKSCVRGTSVDFDSKLFGADAIDSNYLPARAENPVQRFGNSLQAYGGYEMQQTW